MGTKDSELSNKELSNKETNNTATTDNDTTKANIAFIGPVSYTHLTLPTKRIV